MEVKLPIKLNNEEEIMIFLNENPYFKYSKDKDITYLQEHKLINGLMEKLHTLEKKDIYPKNPKEIDNIIFFIENQY